MRSILQVSWCVSVGWFSSGCVSGAKTSKRAPSRDYSSVNQRTWILEEFPMSTASQKECKSSSGLFCDPDGLLTQSEAALLDDVLSSSEQTPRHVPCRKAHVPVQYGSSLLYRMDLTNFRDYDDPESKAAQLFAQSIHDTWGVGHESDCGGTGALLFLSDRDRTVYISRGKLLERVFTDRRLDTVINHMKPHLREGNYGKALVEAFQELDFLLEKGEPGLVERISDWIVAYFGLMWILIIFGLVYSSVRSAQARQREYAVVASHLDELDRTRAEALQGRFQATSCPICLERFVEPGSQGSDHKPLKLLRCGHVFDDTCWSEWVSSGQGQVDRCPICKQSVAPDHTAAAPRDARVTRRTGEDGGPTHATTTRVFQQYQSDRNFRLRRLGHRYPRLVRPQQIQRWTSDSYDGFLARDPTFTELDPTRVSSKSGSSSRSHRGMRRSSSTFGGGQSSGGRGGRW